MCFRMATYERMLEDQEGCCAICGEEAAFAGGRWTGVLHVDYDYATGVVRGLLCHNCNTGLSKLGDTVERLEKATEYLRRTK